jgi:hypothetical protein
MKVFILGIDGLEYEILEKYSSELPNFAIFKEKGYLGKINSVYPADSVPAWLTIFTGLNPSEHGIIRGKDYVESVDDFEKKNNFKLEGNSFWDKLCNKNLKCLVLNPFLAYPAWPINGLMISGPAFIEGKISKFPEHTYCNSAVYGGYKPMKYGKLKRDLMNALYDTKMLWKEFKIHSSESHYDLTFVTFTTLDRIQHYTWRFNDKNNYLYEKDQLLSGLIKKALIFLDSCLGEIISMMNNNDKLVIVSDHGFGQRPYNLINLNELLRREGLLQLIESENKSKTKYKQRIRNITIKLLSNLKILDVVAGVLKKIPYIRKYKKSGFLIDKVNSLCYVDEFFSGKNAYCGFNFGEKIKESSDKTKQEVFEKLNSILQNDPSVPNPLWINFSHELYKGKYIDRYPDICLELPYGYGVEFEFFGELLTKSVSHYKISGGHRNPGVFGIFSPSGATCHINKLEEFHDLIISFFEKEYFKK